jgi:hypothetical protein
MIPQAASGRQCQPGHRATASASRTTSGGECDPKHSIEGRQNGSLTFSLEGGELQPQGSIFDGDGLVTAQQESDESKDRQEKGWHVLRLFGPNPFQVNLLRADAIMANHSFKGAEFVCPF